MQTQYQTKVLTPTNSEPCRECGGSGEVEESFKTAKGTIVRKHRCPKCGGTQQPGYRTK